MLPKSKKLDLLLRLPLSMIVDHFILIIPTKEVVHVDEQAKDQEFPDCYPAYQSRNNTPYAWGSSIPEHKSSNNVELPIDYNHLPNLPYRMSWEIQECRGDIILIKN